MFKKEVLVVMSPQFEQKNGHSIVKIAYWVRWQS